MFIQQNNGRESLLDKRDGYLIEIRRKDWSNKLHKKRLQALSQNQGSHGKSPVMQTHAAVQKEEFDSIIEKFIDMDLDNTSFPELESGLKEILKNILSLGENPDNGIIMTELCKKHNLLQCLYLLAGSTEQNSPECYKIAQTCMASITGYIDCNNHQLIKEEMIALMLKVFKQESSPCLKMAATFLSNLTCDGKESIRVLLSKGYLWTIVAHLVKGVSNDDANLIRISLENLNLLLRKSFDDGLSELFKNQRHQQLSIGIKIHHKFFAIRHTEMVLYMTNANVLCHQITHFPELDWINKNLPAINQIISLKDEGEPKLCLVVIKLVGTLAFVGIDINDILLKFDTDDFHRYLKSPKTETRRITFWAISNFTDEREISNKFLEHRDLMQTMIEKSTSDKFNIRTECLEVFCRLANFCDLQHFRLMVEDYCIMNLFDSLLKECHAQLILKVIDQFSVLIEKGDGQKCVENGFVNPVFEKGMQKAEDIENLQKNSNPEVYERAFEFMNKHFPCEDV